MKHSQWFEGLLYAEREYQYGKRVSEFNSKDIPKFETMEFSTGVCDFVKHMYSKRYRQSTRKERLALIECQDFVSEMQSKIDGAKGE
jgi:hypothetical protein